MYHKYTLCCVYLFDLKNRILLNTHTHTHTHKYVHYMYIKCAYEQRELINEIKILQIAISKFLEEIFVEICRSI